MSQSPGIMSPKSNDQSSLFTDLSFASFSNTSPLNQNSRIHPLPPGQHSNLLSSSSNGMSASMSSLVPNMMASQFNTTNNNL